MKKTIVWILLLTMLVSSVVACGKADVPDVTTTSADTVTDASSETTTETVAPVETVAPELQDTLPELNFNNETFTALSRRSTVDELFCAEQSGDLVGDAVYERNSLIEERFGVKIEVLEADGGWEDRTSFSNRVTNSIMGGDHEFDMVMTHNGYLATLAQKGCGLDMNTLEQLDFSKKWWCQKYVENVAIDGKVYTAMGDIGYTLYGNLNAVFFNKQLAAESNIPDLYATVRSGDWTFEKMMGYVKLVGADLNGDGKYTDKDLYGLSIDNHNCRYASTIWQTEMTKVGADGRRDINLPNDRYINCYETMYNAVRKTQQVYYSGDASSDTHMFVANQVLFLTDMLSEAAKMREMESDYGIIPFPKYDSEQKEYVSATNDGHSGLLIANNIQNPAMVGTVVEALCMYGRTEVTPAYYETTLKLKYTSDEIAMSMLDLIRDSVDFDFLCLYNTPLNFPYSLYGNCITQDRSSIASSIKAEAYVWQKQLDKMYDTFGSTQ